MAAMKQLNKLQFQCSIDHKYEFLPYNTAYLQKKNNDYELYL